MPRHTRARGVPRRTPTHDKRRIITATTQRRDKAALVSRSLSANKTPLACAATHARAARAASVDDEVVVFAAADAARRGDRGNAHRVPRRRTAVKKGRAIAEGLTQHERWTVVSLTCAPRVPRARRRKTAHHLTTSAQTRGPKRKGRRVTAGARRPPSLEPARARQ
eukprot:4515103-Prymnesium_polylepis.1